MNITYKYDPKTNTLNLLENTCNSLTTVELKIIDETLKELLESKISTETLN